MGFLDHLRELRDRVVWALGGYAVAVGVIYYFRIPLTEWLLRPYLHHVTGGTAAGGAPRILSLGEGLAFDMKLSVWGGLVLAAPWICFQLWKFVRPALKPREARVALPVLVTLGALFIAGVLFAWKWLLPPMFQFFIEYNRDRFEPVITLSSLWEMESRFMFWCGVIFEMPVAALLLGLAGLLRPGTLAKFWRWAILGSFILGAIITPTADPVNMCLMAVPILLLYFLSIATCALGRMLTGRKQGE